MAKVKKIDIFKIMKEDNNTADNIDYNKSEDDEKVKKYGPRDFVISLFTKEEIPESVIEKQYDQFMINRFLICTKEYVNGESKFAYIELVNDLNCGNISNKMHYDYLYHILPKKSKAYPAYIWNKKDENSAYEKFDKIKALIWKYKYNEIGAEIAIKVCPEIEINEIVDEYKLYMKNRG